MKKCYLLFLVVIASIQMSLACSCIPLGPLSIKDFNETSAIFIGKVKSVSVLTESASQKQIEVVFEISKIFKGLSSIKEVKVYTASSSASCGLYFRKNEEWLINAHVFNGVLTTNMCSRSRKLPFVKNGELDLLQSFSHHSANKVWMVNGVKRGEGILKNYIPVGKWKYFYANGLIAEEGSYLNGKLDGKWIRYVDIDLLKSELLTVKMISNDSVLNKIDYDHRLWEIAHYKGGKKHGEVMIYNIITSKQARLMYFEDDQQTGLSIDYFPSGLIETTGYYLKNSAVGIHRGYYDNGQLMYEGEYTGEKSIFKVYEKDGKFMGNSNGPPYYDPVDKKIELNK